MPNRCRATLPLGLAAVIVTAALAAPCVAFANPPQIFWSTFSTTVDSAWLDGSNIANPFISPSGAGAIDKLATDGQYLYWVDLGTGTIGRALLGGTGANDSFISLPSGTEPEGVAVNDDYIYWSDSNTTKLLSGTAKFTTAAAHATLRRDGVTYAHGPATRLTGSRWQMLLTEQRAIRPGVYTLTVRTGSRRTLSARVRLS
jgi:hypothetical protein